jgi:hypothetical protein
MNNQQRSYQDSHRRTLGNEYDNSKGVRYNRQTDSNRQTSFQDDNTNFNNNNRDNSGNSNKNYNLNQNNKRSYNY